MSTRAGGLHRNRDLVFVDQRGTGKSRPLECDRARTTRASPSASTTPRPSAFRGCLAGYDAGTRASTPRPSPWTTWTRCARRWATRAQPVRRLLRHARGAGVPAPAPGARAHASCWTALTPPSMSLPAAPTARDAAARAGLLFRTAARRTRPAARLPGHLRKGRFDALLAQLAKPAATRACRRPAHRREPGAAPAPQMPSCAACAGVLYMPEAHVPGAAGAGPCGAGRLGAVRRHTASMRTAAPSGDEPVPGHVLLRHLRGGRTAGLSSHVEPAGKGTRSGETCGGPAQGVRLLAQGQGAQRLP